MQQQPHVAWAEYQRYFQCTPDLTWKDPAVACFLSDFMAYISIDTGKQQLFSDWDPMQVCQRLLECRIWPSNTDDTYGIIAEFMIAFIQRVTSTAITFIHPHFKLDAASVLWYHEEVTPSAIYKWMFKDTQQVMDVMSQVFSNWYSIWKHVGKYQSSEGISQNDETFADFALCSSSYLRLLERYDSNVAYEFMSKLSEELDGELLSTINRVYHSTLPQLGCSAICKQFMLQLAYTVFDVLYFTPLSDSRKDDSTLYDAMTADVQHLVDSIPSNIDASQFVNLDTAPLLADLASMTSFVQKLQSIKFEDDAISNFAIATAVHLMETVRGPQLVSAPPTSQNTSMDTLAMVAHSQENLIEPASMDYVRQTSLIDQVLEIFPDVGAGFIDACLQVYGGSTERVINALLTEELDISLASLDRQMPRLVPIENSNFQTPLNLSANEFIPDLPPAYTEVDYTNNVLKERQNIYDNDEFDVLKGTNTLDHSRAFAGGKRLHIEPDSRITKDFLETHDIYDDEYDDTYDDDQYISLPEAQTEDEGPVVEFSTRPQHTQNLPPRVTPQQEFFKDPNADRLLEYYTRNAESFANTADVRKSALRGDMTNSLKMSHEQIEGWAVMFHRNPQRHDILEEYYRRISSCSNTLPAFKQGSGEKSRGNSNGRSRGGRGSSRGGRGRGSHKNAHAKKVSRGMSLPQ